jgi:ATP:ADP antiporter, AAA family
VLLRGTSGDTALWVGRAFFVWTSIFNMFVVSIFWSVMADVFSTAQSTRLFGFIGAGGTIGGIAGAAITSWLVGPLGSANLLLVSVVLLEVAGLAARRLFAVPRTDPGPAVTTATATRDGAIGGSVWEGMRRSITDSYLVNVTLNMLLFTVLTTFLYFQQATIVDAALTDRAERTRFFANIDLLVNTTELATQTFATGRLVRAVGVPIALALLPALSIPGFIWLALSPTIPVLMAFQVFRRSFNFSVARPSREMLFTVVPATDRYKAKTFIDTVVYRAGDQIGAWVYAPVAALGAGVAGISSVAVVLAVVAVANALWLGRKMQRRAAAAGLTVIEAPPAAVVGDRDPL